MSSFPVWPLGVPDAIAKIQYKEKAIDYAVAIGRALGPHGLAHRLITAAEHQLRFGVAPAPIEDPGPYQPGDAVAVANHKRNLDIYDLQLKLDPLLEVAVEAAWPTHFRDMMVVDHSLRHLTLAQQFTFMDANLSLTQEDLRIITCSISAPYVAGQKIETHVANQLQAIRHLASAQQPLSNIEATKLMTKAYTATSVSMQDFAPCLAEFLKDHGSIAEQTPANFGNHVTKYVNERLAHHQTANELSRASQRAAHAVVLANAEAAHAELLALRTAAVQPQRQPCLSELRFVH